MVRGVRQQESQWNKEGDAPHPPDLIPGAEIRKPEGQKVDNLEDYRGKNIEIKVIEYNPEKKKIVGSERVLVKAARDKAESEVWAKAVEGAELEGTIREIKDYGCFVDLGVEINGLVHISQLSDSYVSDPHEVVTPGDIIKVKITELDLTRNRISLTMKKSELGNKKE